MDDDDKTVMRGGTQASTRNAQTIIAPGQYAANILPAGTRLGQFEILGLIGEGGFGIVYLACDHSLERQVALKEYMPSAFAARTANQQIAVKSERHADTFRIGLHSFINEAKLLARFDHPALVKVHQFWEENGTAYMVMPFYEGLTLKQALKEGAVTPSEAWFREFLGKLIDAIEIMHAGHCLHRDIAPDNILVLRNGHPLLLDFGAARHVISDLTQDLTAILKPGFAPIEQYANVNGMKQGPWTDVYALAAVMYYAISGRAPPPAISRMLNDEMVPAREIGRDRYSEGFLEAIDRALVVQPAQRTQSIAELRRMFDSGSATGERALPVSRDAPATQAASGLRRSRQQSAMTHAASELSGLSELTAVAPSASPAARQRRPGWIAAGIMALLAAAVAGIAYWWPDATVTAPAVSPQSPQPSASQPSANPSAATPFDMRKVLDDIRAQAEPDWKVSVTVEQQSIRIGMDQLRLHLASARDGYVYLLMLGTDRQALHMLFPNSQDAGNQVKANAVLQLPGPGWSIAARGPAGEDRLLVIVSDVPRDFGTAGLMPGEQSGIITEDAARRAAANASVAPGKLFAGTPLCPVGQPSCPGAFGAALFSVSEVNP